MADAVTTRVILDAYPHYVVQFTNASDGTGESAVKKIDKSTLAGALGVEPLAVDIEAIQFSVEGFNYITLLWDHGTDDTVAVLSGSNFFDYRGDGLNKDPTPRDSTGDILLTTDGAFDGASYNIILHCRMRGG